ncbi:SWIM zinc finger domain-containing protein [Paenibacillus doosanensis]|uniref:SWIM zinc finger family protein n=1 Tax=Paenibacillus doosanensis TaxID=1229154 RepID=UPI00217FC4D3|nr:SWIM zinc finger family protein [Paenibacillus doosanensis]MCS7463896.1 SWIM zinc finger domain-containing protein [Paenibacillus doosanensis]
MIDITETYVDSLALNAAAVKNGRDLARKNSFPKLCRSEDQTLLFGECKGSGKEPYRCSADYAKPGSPVFRCSCPSRQFPCKHILGLLYAFASGAPFQTEQVPEDVADKREKAEKREEKKQAAGAAGTAPSAAKRKTNKSALVKKIASQLEGLGLLDKLVRQITQSGLAGIDPKTLHMLEEQSKQLGNYYLPGAQAALRELLLLLQTEENREAVYTEAMDRLTVLYALVRKGRERLEARKNDPEAPMDAASTLEERLGHAWQLAELREHGRVLPEAELLQLAFRSYEDEARAEYVDEGWWVHLQSGAVYPTRNYRPVRAAKHMKEEDSTEAVVKTSECFVYPGEMNPRIRWEAALFREPGSGDYAKVRAAACRSFAEAVKTAKNHMKNPLGEKRPVMLLHAARLHKADGTYVLEDDTGKRLALGDADWSGRGSTELLPLLKAEHTDNQTFLVMMKHDFRENRLQVQPLSLITDTGVVRLI